MTLGPGKGRLEVFEIVLVLLFLQDQPPSEIPGNHGGSVMKTQSRRKPFWNGGVKTSENKFFQKAIRTLTKIVKIRCFRTLGIKQRLNNLRSIFFF